jgi:two-component system LytT family response regulator
MPLRVLIADDEAPAREKLRRLLGQEGDVEVVGEVATGREAVAAIARSLPDVVFLDIQMPGIDGFGVVEALGAARAPHVVFVTAYGEHALKAYEVGAIDYLLKPFSPARFQSVLTRVRGRVADERERSKASDEPAYLSRMLVEEDGRALFIRTDQIDRVEADRNYVSIVAGGRRFRVRATMAAVERRLDPELFLRISRSALVRYDAIRELHEWSHGDYHVVLHDGTRMTWSRRFRAMAKRAHRV